MFEPASSPVQHRRPLPPADPPSGNAAAPRGRAAVPRGGDRPQDRPGKARDAFFDNAKYLAIVLVAIGHSWEPLQSGSRTVEAFYLFVYTFHMPAFIMVSGYFSRSFDARPDRLRRLITGVAVPYVIFETAYALFERYVGDTPDNPISLLDPWFLTWFLPALFVWRLTAPLWRTIRWPLALSMVIAALAALSPAIGDDFDFQRVLQFLPFFVLGLRLRPEHIDLLHRRSVRLLSLPVIAAAGLVAYKVAPHINYEWFYRYDSAQELGAPWWTGPVMTLLLSVCSLALAACFFAWVPRRHTWFTALGAGTMYGYLLHGFLVKGALYRGGYDHPWVHGPVGETAVTVAAAAAVTLLCTPPVRRVFRYVVEPRLGWVFRKAAPAER